MKKFLTIFTVVVLFSALVGSYLVLGYSYSNGTRSGRLVKLSKKGFLLKTYEGTLDLESGDQLTWEFSLHDDDMGDILVKHTGKLLSLEYRELLYPLFYGTKYDVIAWKIEKAGDGDSKLFCRLAALLRRNRSVVEYVSGLISQNDPELLDEIRECQK